MGYVAHLVKLMTDPEPPPPAGRPAMHVVCAIITDAAGRVLAARRPHDKALPGKWEFPGGKVETDEEPIEALEREILEELGCCIRVDAPLPPVEHDYPHGRVVLQPYRATLTAGFPECREHAELRWVAAADIDGLDWAEADVPLLPVLKQGKAAARKKRNR